MASHKKMTKEEFDKIKTLCNTSLSNKQIMQVTGRSIAVIIYVKRADSYDEYREIVDKVYRNSNYFKKRNEEKAQAETKTAETKTIETAETTLESPEVIVLTRIAMALERLADAWENSPKKRSLF